MATTEAKIQEQEQVQSQHVKESTPGAEDFFKSQNNDRTGDLDDFISHMKTPREQMDLPNDGQGEPGPPNEGDELDDSDQEMMSHFDYTPEHRYLAEFFLVQIDKAVAFSLSMLSGSEAEKYRRRLKKPSGEDYEAEILAALLKKYQMRMSLEWMFMSAMVIAYTPMVDQAVKDRRYNLAKMRDQVRQEQTPQQPAPDKKTPKAEEEKAKEA